MKTLCRFASSWRAPLVTLSAIAYSFASSAQCLFEVEPTQVAAIVTSEQGTFEKTDALFDHVKNRIDEWESIPRKDELEDVVRFVANSLLTGENNPARIGDGLQKAVCAARTAIETDQNRLNVAKAASTAAGVNEPENEEQIALIGDVGDNRDYLRLYTGVGNSLEANGSWESNGELLFVSAHDWSPFRLCEDAPTAAQRAACASRRHHQIRGTAEFEFTELGEIDDGGEPAQGENVDPFDAGGGIFRFNATGAYRLRNSNDLKVVGGVGFTTQPDQSLSATNARGRYYLGIRVDNAKLGARREAFLVIGMSKDRLWKFNETVDINGVATIVARDESARYVVEGRMTIPGIFGENRNVWLSGRVFADLPRSGDGPSDIRVSLHVSSDLNRLFNR